eukprot:gene34320-biopygen25457
MFAAPDRTLLDLPWPLLVVYAPLAQQRVKRERRTSSPPPIVRTGEAASVRDLNHQISGDQFLKALQAEKPTRLSRLDMYAGRDKPLERVLRRFWWKGAAEDVGRWISSCMICQAVRPRNSFPDGLPHRIPTRLWQVVSVGFVTGLPVTARNHDAFATFTCKLSKMVHITPLNFQDSSAEVIARIYFDRIWKLHGAPMKIVSDRDPRFQDAMWKELMRLMGTNVASTTPYNPRSDGQAEHTNRVVKDMLRSFAGNNPEDWDLWCANAEFAINDTRSVVTGFTPFELVLGHSPMSQLWTSFSKPLRGSTPSARAEKLGDFLVWVDAKHLTENIMNRESFRKLGPRWHGPLPIIERANSREFKASQEVRRQRKQKREHARTLTFLDTSGEVDLNSLDNFYLGSSTVAVLTPL